MTGARGPAMTRVTIRLATALLLTAAGATAAAAAAPVPGAAPDAGAGVRPLAPHADHHLHLLSPVTASMAAEPPLPAVDVPAELAAPLRALTEGWNDRAAIARLLAEDVALLNLADGDRPSWILGREQAAELLSQLFARAYEVTPVAYRVEAASAHVAGYFTRPEGAERNHFGHFFAALRRAPQGWQIAALTPTFPGPAVRRPITAGDVVAQLDEAGIRRAAVLSVAYWFGSAWSEPVPDEAAKVRAENDWVSRQVAAHPDRLVAFCGFNPLKDYALVELARCASLPGVVGVKLHFGNSGVDLRDATHLARVREVFRAADERGMAIVAHLWTGPEYEERGAEDARIFLEQVLPAAPRATVQIAHLAGGGRSTDTALGVFAEAIAAGDPRTRHLYFDIATLTAGQSVEGLRRDARRLRQIGLERILYGTDASPPNPSPRLSWGQFRAAMPLGDEEIRAIADNVAPYLRDGAPGIAAGGSPPR